MRKLGLVLCLLSSSASAQPLTVSDCINMLNGLNLIDHTIAPDGKQISNHYKFDPATWFAMAKDIAALTPVAEAAQKAWNQSVADLGKRLEPNAPETLVFQNRYQKEVLDKPCNVRLEHFSVKNLRGPKDENDIPPGTVAQILVLDDNLPEPHK